MRRSALQRLPASLGQAPEEMKETPDRKATFEKPARAEDQVLDLDAPASLGANGGPTLPPAQAAPKDASDECHRQPSERIMDSEQPLEETPWYAGMIILVGAGYVGARPTWTRNRAQRAPSKQK